MSIRVDRKTCVGCGDCVTACPEDALEIFDGTAVLMGPCSACLACVSSCFVKAIHPTAQDGSPLATDRPLWRHSRGGPRKARRQMS
jgi:ferredoxin